MAMEVGSGTAADRLKSDIVEKCKIAIHWRRKLHSKAYDVFGPFNSPKNSLIIAWL